MIIQGDALTILRTLPDDSVQCCVTSPPYWGLRDYGVPGQLGLESTPEEYVAKMVEVFSEVRRVLRDDGTLWLNLGDSYCSTAPGTMGDKLNQRGILAGVSDRRAEGSRKPRPETPNGLKPKDLVGIPWMVAFALRADGWYLRSDIIWNKLQPMPESVKDRPTKSHEYMFLLAKSQRYYYDQESTKEPAIHANQTHRLGPKSLNRPAMMSQGKEFWGNSKKEEITIAEKKNLRSVWTLSASYFREAHFATFPEKLVEPCIKAGSRIGDIVLDPFSGAATVGVVCKKLQREFIGIELNPEYCRMGEKRIEKECGGLL